VITDQKVSMSCISRVTAIDARCYFADQKHKFFLEMRCGRPCLDLTRNVCDDCSVKTMSTIQWCRKIDHGTIYDPITDRSHLFGGNWYEDGVRKWGAPSAESIELALAYQRKARTIHDTVVGPSKVRSPSPPMEPVKRGRKPKVAPAVAPVVAPAVASAVESAVTTNVEPNTVSNVLLTEQPVTEQPVKKAAAKRPRKPKAVTPVKMADPSMVQKEVVLPTHMEQEREEVDTDGFEIEYVKLSVFTLGDATYFRDSKKNKLYKKIKEKTIGCYVGRYDPTTETVHTDVPDSDDEAM